MRFLIESTLVKGIALVGKNKRETDWEDKWMEEWKIEIRSPQTGRQEVLVQEEMS